MIGINPAIPAVPAGLLWVYLVTGCVSNPAPLPIYEDDHLSVRVAYDSRTAGGHSHPQELGSELIAHVLKGLLIVDRKNFPEFMFKGGGGPRRAFSDLEAKHLAPILSKALKTASARDLVTFHWILPDADKGAVITSGGLFVDVPRLVVVIANCRAFPSLSYEGMTAELDTRNAPLVPYRPRAFRLGFQDGSLLAPLDFVSGHYRFDDENIAVAIDLERLRLAVQRSGSATGER